MSTAVAFDRTITFIINTQSTRIEIAKMTNKVSIALDGDKGRVEGFCDERFQPVLDAFVDNFDAGEEQGASVNINIEGQTVVNLWGGRQHPAQESDWNEDTLCVVHSVTKAGVALCAHILIAEGKLELHAPVSNYWPEFAQGGKENTTVAMMLNHSCAVPALREPIKSGGFLDWDYMTGRLAQEQAFWEPGTAHGYQMTTFGWTVGELVRRVSGLSLGDFFRERVTEPLGLDFHIGLAESEHHRVSRVIPWKPRKDDPMSAFTLAVVQDGASLQSRALLNNGGYKTDRPESYLCEFGAGGGPGIAGMYQALANGGGSLVGRTDIERMSAVSVASGEDRTLLMPSRFGYGFMLSMDNRHRPLGQFETAILGKHAFGHAGAGGSLGFADTECHMGFAYTMNKMGTGILLNTRSQSLVDAAYQSAGYTTDEPGYWIKA